MTETGGNEKFTLEMPKVGIIRGVQAKDIEVTGQKTVNLRVCARPYSNVYTSGQLRALKHVIETFGSGLVHLSPRHNLEIPEIAQNHVDSALKELYTAGLFPGGAGTSVRNIFTCPQWCTKALRQVRELGLMVSRNFADMDMPNKVTVSFAGCPNGCSRPETCDIGIIATDSSGGFSVLIGGKEGMNVRFAALLTECASEFEVIEIIDTVINNYRNKARLRPGSERKKERLAEVIDRLGLNEFMQKG